MNAAPTRRAVLVGLVALAAPGRPRAHGQKVERCMGMQADNPGLGVFFILIVQGAGGGEFVYDASGNLRSANVGQVTTDPQQGITCQQGISTFNGHGAVISLNATALDAQFWYADTGSSTQGGLVISITNASSSGTDPFGNTFQPGTTFYQPALGTSTNIVGANTTITSTAAGTRIVGGGGLGLDDATADNAQPALTVGGPVTAAVAANTGFLTLYGKSKDGTKPAQVLVSANASTPSTKALLEVGGDLQAGNGVSIGQGIAEQTLVNGSTISTAGVTMQPVTCAASVTGIIMQPGTFDGQMMAVPSNAGAGVTITFAVAATSHVSVGASGVIQPGSTGLFFWVSAHSLWFPVVSV